jgi:hypothetical protein
VSDVKYLLGLALDEGHGPARDAIADPGADLARGRRLLRRRRMLGLAGVTAAVAVGALVPLALQSVGTPGSHLTAAAERSAVAARSNPGRWASGATTSGPSAAARASSAPIPSAGRHVALVAWTGTQPPGYQVSWMPSGWVVQGSNPFALTIAPPGDPDTNPDSFLGKLVVMLQSKSVTSPPPGTSQPVNGRAGVFQPASDAGGDTEILTFQVADGQWVVVQAPMSLGWSSAELAKFAGGVQVLAAAQQGAG